MINPIVQKKLAMLAWSTSVVGTLAMLGIVVVAYQAQGLLVREREALESQRRDDLSLLARAERVRADQAAAAQQFQSLSETLAEMNRRIPTSPKEAEFLSQLSTLAERTGVRLKHFRPGQATAAGSVNTCDVQLSLVGTFANICKLIDGLSEVPRQLNVARLTLVGPQTGGDACLADVTISLCFAAAIEKHLPTDGQ